MIQQLSTNPATTFFALFFLIQLYNSQNTNAYSLHLMVDLPSNFLGLLEEANNYNNNFSGYMSKATSLNIVLNEYTLELRSKNGQKYSKDSPWSFSSLGLQDEEYSEVFSAFNNYQLACGQRVKTKKKDAAKKRVENFSLIFVNRFEKYKEFYVEFQLISNGECSSSNAIRVSTTNKKEDKGENKYTVALQFGDAKEIMEMRDQGGIKVRTQHYPIPSVAMAAR